ncbi:RNA polymerase sigma factor [Hwanghaeella sp. LZ110]|uniref:RNA polymerase sigma factor n=1 Tax=Hwanghaeella sp. LZ110 TaxID=3402810 RepID=UPI003B6711E9
MPDENRSRLVCLLLEHYDDLTRYLARRIGSQGAARDVVHDTYLKLSRLDTVPPLTNPRAYLYRMADNIALDRLRADNRRQKTFVGSDMGEGRPSDMPGSEESVTQRQRIALLSRAIDALPTRQRQVFLMHKIDGLSHAEIARTLGISKSMVEKHIMRALAQCRDSVEKNT